jgi:hypothetical protein
MYVENREGHGHQGQVSPGRTDKKQAPFLTLETIVKMCFWLEKVCQTGDDLELRQGRVRKGARLRSFWKQLVGTTQQIDGCHPQSAFVDCNQAGDVPS